MSYGKMIGKSINGQIRNEWSITESLMTIIKVGRPSIASDVPPHIKEAFLKAGMSWKQIQLVEKIPKSERVGQQEWKAKLFYKEAVRMKNEPDKLNNSYEILLIQHQKLLLNYWK